VASYEAHLGILDEGVVHEQCQLQVDNLNIQLQAANQDVTNISIEKNKLENELSSLRLEMRSLRESKSSSKNVRKINLVSLIKRLRVPQKLEKFRKS
jgi:uncharacterized protein (DUF3084 family)